jgi:hypothetical protein
MEHNSWQAITVSAACLCWNNAAPIHENAPCLSASQDLTGPCFRLSQAHQGGSCPCCSIPQSLRLFRCRCRRPWSRRQGAAQARPPSPSVQASAVTRLPRGSPHHRLRGLTQQQLPDRTAVLFGHVPAPGHPPLCCCCHSSRCGAAAWHLATGGTQRRAPARGFRRRRRNTLRIATIPRGVIKIGEIAGSGFSFVRVTAHKCSRKRSVTGRPAAGPVISGPTVTVARTRMWAAAPQSSWPD